jgi:hypothetical protein
LIENLDKKEEDLAVMTINIKPVGVCPSPTGCHI